jgi:hypothetical protein
LASYLWIARTKLGWLALTSIKLPGDYRRCYGPENPFHNHFFRSRLNATTDGLAFGGKCIPDVGVGTGPLYDDLTKHSGVDYYACDISEKMLSQSSIPPAISEIGR